MIYGLSTKTKQRLSNLAIKSIENEICENLNYRDLIVKFSVAMARKINFVLVFYY